MDDLSIPSTAIYAGSLTRTFEYRTTGAHATPHLHWSFPLKEGAMVSCPVLVTEDVVYVGDSAGFFSALDARSGNLLWCFATDWALGEGNDNWAIPEAAGVTGFCLAGWRGYVVSAYQTLYELDLRNGQVIRSWKGDAWRASPERYMIYLPLFYDQLVWIDDWGWISRFDPATERLAPALFPCYIPIMYRPPRGDFDVIYGYAVFHDDDDDDLRRGFYAINLSLFLDPAREKVPLEEAILWWIGKGDGKEVCEDVHYGLYTVMDDVLYAVCDQRSADHTHLLVELLALDPLTGAVQWRYTFPGDEYEFPLHLAAASGLVFLANHKGIEAVDTHTHRPRWTWTSNCDSWRHALAADGLLFVLDGAGQITALDANTGQLRWTWQTKQPIDDWVSTIADATLYLAVGHTLCAFR